MAAELFAVRVPRLQLMTFPLRVQTPMLDWTEPKVLLAGNTLVTFTPFAADGPRFVTRIEYVRLLVIVTGSGESLIDMPRLADGPTVVGTATVLSLVSRSGPLANTVAVFI